MASTKTKSTEKKEPPIFDDSGTSYFAKFINVMDYIYKLFSYYVVGSIKDNKLQFSFYIRTYNLYYYCEYYFCQKSV